MHTRIVLVFAFMFGFTSAGAEEPAMGPVIRDYGPTYSLQDGDVPLQDDFVYRVVFEATNYPGDTTSLNRELVTVARFLNMHARNGVSTSNLDVAVVMHGQATKTVLVDEAYAKRYESDNPNLDLLTKLHEAGVTFYVCGQSLGSRSFGRDEVASPVNVGLSAMTMLVRLQSEGYAFLP